jgi:VWFA-related protein
MNTLGCVLALILFSLSSGWIMAQDQAEVTSKQSSVTFSSRTDLVSVPVVVRDAKGHAVGGLQQSDFRLFDNGKQQTIVHFSALSNETEKTAPEGQTNPNGDGNPRGPLTGKAPANYIAYVFDDIHMNFADIAAMRNAAEKHFQSLAADSRAAIFTTSGRIFQDFTDDRAKLRETLLRIGPGPNALPPIPEPGEKTGDVCPPYVPVFTADRALNDLDPAALMSAEAAAVACYGPDPTPPTMGRMAALQVLSANVVNIKATFESLNALVKRLSVMPGLRSILLISSGFFVTKDLGSVETPLIEAAIRAKVTLNGLDARGRYIADTTAAETQADAMRELAAGTGGRFFEHDNDFVEGLRELAAPPEYSYALAFSPQNLKLDGRYHNLRVSLVSAGFQVQARRGYWAPDHAADAAEQSREEIREAVFSLEEMNSIPVDLTTDFFKMSEEAAELTVQYRLGVNDVHFRSADDRRVDELTIVTGVFDQNGRYVKGVQRVIDLHLREQTFDRMLDAGLTARETFDLSPGRYVVRVVVRDTEGETMSARNAAVAIP